jgi:hypothetical protein
MKQKCWEKDYNKREKIHNEKFLVQLIMKIKEKNQNSVKAKLKKLSQFLNFQVIGIP